jgi:arylsulfatase A-like enzyme
MKPIRAAEALSALVLGVLALFAGGCRARGSDAVAPIRLVDLYKPDPAAAAKGAGVALPPPVEWRFASSTKSPLWTAGPGMLGLTVRVGRLVGRATGGVPVIDLERPPSSDRDVVHEVQVRMRASAGANLAVAIRPAEKVDLPSEVEQVPIIPWPFNSPLVAGDEMRTYVLRTTASIPASFRHVLIRPTDAPGATFEIESIRVVTRREHLAGMSAGLGWHGMSEIYREALVARAPDSLSFDVQLPARPRLELAVGTIEDSPVTFRVTARGGGSAEDDVTVERTVTTPHRWETVTIDLTRLASRKATLALTLASERPRALGFWGTPVIRSVVERTQADPRSPKAATRPQGVILVWMDTLRRDHLPMYGYPRPTSPNLARLAAEGTIFDDCVAQATWTKASGPSILTGLYPTTHGVQSFNDLLPSSATTIAEVYRQAGYATLGLATIQFVGKFSNQHQGFEELHEQGSWPERQTGTTKTARSEVDRLIPWLAAHRDVPFFVLLHLSDPHSPHRPYPPYDSLFGDPRVRDEHEKEREKVRPFIRNVNMRTRAMPSRTELEAAGIDPERFIGVEKDDYDGSIRAMDAELGRLRERLGELGLARRTLIAFLADHGEEFLEHGRTFHNQSVYGELTSVPLFFWGADVPAGRRAADTVQLIDVMPTLLDLSGLAVPKEVQGASLVPLMRDGSHPGWPRPAITEAAGRFDPTVAATEESYAVSLGGWKLAHHVQRPARRPEFQLFDRAKDPLDATDVAGQHPDIVARLSKELEAWQNMARRARLKPDSAAAQTMSAEELERLRALGYVQ